MNIINIINIINIMNIMNIIIINIIIINIMKLFYYTFFAEKWDTLQRKRCNEHYIDYLIMAFLRHHHYEAKLPLFHR